MLSGFRKFGETKASKALLLILVVSFGAWGIGGYLMNAGSLAGLTVNGEDVSLPTLDKSLKQRLQVIEQMTGNKPTPDEALQLRLPQSVVQEAVSRIVLRQTAESLHLVAAPKALRDEIAHIPSFQTNGKFSIERYKAATANIGLTTGQFETELGHDLSVRLLGKLVNVPGTSAQALAPLAALENAKLTLETLTIGLPAVQNTPEPTAADQEAFYKANPQLYTVPEKRTLNVLELTASTLAGSINIPEEKVQAAYDKNKANLVQPEQRHVLHILLSTQEEAAKLAPTLTSEEAFQAAAKASSIDDATKPLGGSLGSIAPTDVVKEFADVAFQLPVGQASAPVQSPFGWHLIWVKAITPGHTLAYAEVKDKIREDLTREEAQKALSELEGRVADAIAAGDPLDAVAHKLGLKLQRFPLITAQTNTLQPDYLNAGFANQPKEISPPINLPDAGVAYVETTDVIPSKVTPLADVQAQVAQDTRAAQLQAALQALATQLTGEARDPGKPAGLTAAATRLNVAGGTPGTLTMSTLAEAPEWLHPALQKVKALPVGGILPTPIQKENEWVLVRLTGRQLATPSVEELQATANGYQKRLQADVEALIISSLAQKAQISYNLPRLRHVFGDKFGTDGAR